jgi:hypothetical protein
LRPEERAAVRRVLCDESVPHDVAAAIADHDVATVQSLGWAGMKNGALLRAARQAGFHVLVTVDRNLEHLQNMAASGLALVVLRSRSTRVQDLFPLMPALLDVLSGVQAGTVTHVYSGERGVR